MNPPDVLLVLRPVRDPLEGPGQPARDADYRLKLALKTLLRAYGLRCVTCRDVKPDAGHVPATLSDLERIA